MESRGAGFAGWNAADRSMLISTRFGNVSQLHRVAGPMMDRRQISFEAEPLGGSLSPTGDVLLVSKDNGGDEFFQLYTLANGRLTLLTAGGKSRNSLGAMEPRRQARRLQLDRAQRHRHRPLRDGPARPATRSAASPRSRAAAGASPTIAPGNAHRDRRRISLDHRQSNSTGSTSPAAQLTPIGDHSKTIAYGGAEFAPDGTLVGHLGRGQRRPAPRPRSTSPPAASPRSAPPAQLGRRRLRHLQGRPHHRLRHQRGGDRPAVAARRRQRPHPPRRPAFPPAPSAGSNSRRGARSACRLNSAKSPTDAYSLDPRDAQADPLDRRARPAASIPTSTSSPSWSR